MGKRGYGNLVRICVSSSGEGRRSGIDLGRAVWHGSDYWHSRRKVTFNFLYRDPRGNRDDQLILSDLSTDLFKHGGYVKRLYRQYHDVCPFDGGTVVICALNS
jgi:hypothetical protein